MSSYLTGGDISLVTRSSCCHGIPAASTASLNLAGDAVAMQILGIDSPFDLTPQSNV
ncbi:hypothetical protein DPMN_171370 [Dreissena polymorpha]|uniref:Uncharacterized protein n=1 Tax=Dreissena polymorpha TaxID=45954 RepID=A0A9D4IDP1_DREPO|nr:hypothetical protein DPMN_171370 [Dreissena polymorpha]